MKVLVADSADAAYRTAAQLLIEQINLKKACRLGLSTGGTAKGIYRHVVAAYREGQVDFSEVSTVNLDEYIGLSPDSPSSYRQSMDRWLFDQVNIDKANTFVPSGVNDAQQECARFAAKLQEGRPIDLQLLGVGVSGHIGFNEPGDHLISGVHIQSLHPSTIRANARFFTSEAEVPRAAITMGVGDILKASRILLVATGKSKAQAMKALLKNDRITTQAPVTMLKTHRDVTVILDEPLSQAIGY